MLITRPHGTVSRTFDVDNRTRLQSLLKLCNRRTGQNVILDVVKNDDVQKHWKEGFFGYFMMKKNGHSREFPMPGIEPGP